MFKTCAMRKTHAPPSSHLLFTHPCILLVCILSTYTVTQTRILATALPPAFTCTVGGVGTGLCDRSHLQQPRRQRSIMIQPSDYNTTQSRVKHLFI